MPKLPIIWEVRKSKANWVELLYSQGKEAYPLGQETVVAPGGAGNLTLPQHPYWSP